MAFGPELRVAHDEFDLTLAPLRRDQLGALVAGASRLSFSEHLGPAFFGIGFTQETALDFFERQRTASDRLTWGIYADGALVGATSATIRDAAMRTATTWAGIFDARVRGHGVATVCHRARTWYLFAVLGLDALRSGHHHLNVASGRALARVGYVATGLQRNDNLVHGRFAHEMLVECVNPADAPWARWWGSDPVPAEFVAARERTRAALDWAAAHVSCRDDRATGASAIKTWPGEGLAP